MNFDNIRVEIKPRSSFEAMDLGFAMARHWFFPLWLMWIAAAIPVCLISHLVFFKHIAGAGFIVWWLKPVFERPLVFWFSRAVFNEKVKFKDIRKQYFKIIKPRLIADLTYLRFSPNRSFFMPVAILENLKGKDYLNRVQVLGHNQSAGMGLTIVCIIFNTILDTSILLFIFFILPEDLCQVSFKDFFLTPGLIHAVLIKIIAMLAMSIIAPFYTGAGFALYINRRTELEAWDIEMSFKRLIARGAEKEKIFMQRIRKINKTTKGMINIVIYLLVLLISSNFLFPNIVSAEINSTISKDTACHVIEQVLDHEDFGKKKLVTSWKLKELHKTNFELPQWLKDFFKSFGQDIGWVKNISKFIGFTLEILAWIIGGLIIAVIIYKIVQNRQWIQGYGKKFKHKRDIPTQLFGLKLSEESLPNNIIFRVRELLNNNEIRKALSLLYRGSLIKLITEYNLQIPKSATENECVALVKIKRDHNEFEFFSALTKIWLAMAYGNISPERQILEQICQKWQRLYEAA